MADIFLSYAKEDREAAHRLSMLLEGAGWSVWWDRRIPAGRTWRDVLEEALRSMGCMVVLWSSHSVDSDWVKEEAEEARSIKKLVPVLIDVVNPPVGFRAIQAADLTDWDGASESVGARQLIADLELIIGKPSPRGALESQPRIQLGQNAHERRTEVGTTGVETAQRRAERPVPSSRDATKNNALRWKIVAAGGVALALALGVIALWRDTAPVTDEVAKAVATSPTQSPAEIPPAPKVEKLVVHGARQELKPDETLPLSVRGRFSDGSESEITSSVEWSSSEPGVAKVDDAGRVNALQSGTTKITATYGGATSSAWTLAVKSPPPKPAPALVALTVNSHKKELEPQEKIALKVTGKYSDGTEKTLSSGWVLTNNNAGIVSINDKGEVEAWRAGNADIIARSGNVTSAPLRLVVKAPPAKLATGPQERKSSVLTKVEVFENISDDMPRKTPDYAAVEKTPDTRPVVPQVSTEQLRAKIAPFLSLAKSFRAQGDYHAALAQLAAARALDPASQEIRAEIEQTKRACLAERKLGRAKLDCD